jgi:hypothetical protein
MGLRVKKVIDIVKWLIVVTSLAAALCWHKAATAKAPDVGRLGPEDQYVAGSFSQREGHQIIAYAALQSWWNTRAAIFATLAAVFTAVDALLYAML